LVNIIAVTNTGNTILDEPIHKSDPLRTTNYLYDGLGIKSNVIEEVDNNTILLARYTQGQRLDQPLAEFQLGTISYYEQDALGSITSLSNSAASLTNTYTYDTFGKPTATTGTMTNPFQYTGREFDPETEIYEYRARYYDQNVGRFLGEDPSHQDRMRDGLNLYRYVRNGPTNYADPLGLFGTNPSPTGPPVFCNCWLVLGIVRASGCSYLCSCSDGGVLLDWFNCPLCSKNPLKSCPVIMIVQTPPGNGPMKPIPVVPSDPCNGSI
jgi:RHS repeat-associated protein